MSAQTGYSCYCNVATGMHIRVLCHGLLELSDTQGLNNMFGRTNKWHKELEWLSSFGSISGVHGEAMIWVRTLHWLWRKWMVGRGKKAGSYIWNNCKNICAYLHVLSALSPSRSATLAMDPLIPTLLGIALLISIFSSLRYFISKIFYTMFYLDIWHYFSYGPIDSNAMNCITHMHFFL